VSPALFPSSLFFFVRFGGAKLHILFSFTKYFFSFLKNIFSLSSSVQKDLTPFYSFNFSLLKKREGKDRYSLAILKTNFVHLLISPLLSGSYFSAREILRRILLAIQALIPTPSFVSA